MARIRPAGCYATGGPSIEALTREVGRNDPTLNDILKNPLYNCWVGRKGERAAAPWRDNSPVDDRRSWRARSSTSKYLTQVDRSFDPASLLEVRELDLGAGQVVAALQQV